MARPQPSQFDLDFSSPPALAPIVPPTVPSSVPAPIVPADVAPRWSPAAAEHHVNATDKPHDPWARWPIDVTASPEHGRALFKIMEKANDFNRNAHTFEMAVDLWLACLDRFTGGEDRYMAIVKKLDPQVVRLIADGFGVLMQHFFYEGGYYDVLGDVYMQVRSAWAGSKLGQYFTPWPLCLMLAQMQIQGDELESKIAARQPITVHDCACGSGAMLLAAKAAVAAKHGRRAAQLVKCYGQDVDGTCCKMARIQLRMVDERFMRDWQICTAADMARQYPSTPDLLGSVTT